MSSTIQLPIDKGVSCRGVLNSSSFFPVVRQPGRREVIDDWVHPSYGVFGTENLLFLFNTGLVEPLYRERDETVHVVPRG
ncbi:hypothetical protein TIFTF001_016755 [Ficus carica]|uniref:Uncharacterized protein n=1 Tax=Ficus carica TaxID=3494 RepID=A0AA88A8B1_FICCA|nr:hypothetical protein TIFTF001_016755 [Ficus carica]